MKSPESLYLAYVPERPPLEDYDVKHREHRQFFGTEFTFTVIGDSHYIGAPALDFHELLSCKPIQAGRVKTVPLQSERQASGVSPQSGSVDSSDTHTERHRFGSVGVTTQIKTEPLSEFPGPQRFDIAYQFGPAAYTTINCRSTDSYETYHTYPEYDCALYTKNEFTELPVGSTDDETRNEMTFTESI
jgi:hypothetical protein